MKKKEEKKSAAAFALSSLRTAVLHKRPPPASRHDVFLRGLYKDLLLFKEKKKKKKKKKKKMPEAFWWGFVWVRFVLFVAAGKLWKTSRGQRSSNKDATFSSTFFFFFLLTRFRYPPRSGFSSSSGSDLPDEMPAVMSSNPGGGGVSVDPPLISCRAAVPFTTWGYLAAPQRLPRLSSCHFPCTPPLQSVKHRPVSPLTPKRKSTESRGRMFCTLTS